MDLAKAQSVGSGSGEMHVRGYKRWQLQRRWGGALGFVRSGFPRARAKGSCCVGLPLGVWIELATMPERTAPIGKVKETKGFSTFSAWRLQNQRFFNLLALKASKTKGFSMFLGSSRARPGHRPSRGQAGSDGARPAADGARPAAHPGPSRTRQRA